MSTRWAPWNAVLTVTRTRTGSGGVLLIVARLDRRRNRLGPPRRTGCRPRWPRSTASSDHRVGDHLVRRVGDRLVEPAVHEQDAPVPPPPNHPHPGPGTRPLKEHGP